MNVGDQGWIAWVSRYPVRVEFVGFDWHEQEWPRELKRFHRALEACSGSCYFHCEPGDIIEDESDLYASRELAAEVANADRQHWLERKRAELAELEKEIK